MKIAVSERKNEEVEVVKKGFALYWVAYSRGIQMGSMGQPHGIFGAITLFLWDNQMGFYGAV